MTTITQQIALENALVAPENQRGIGKCNMRINPVMKPKEPTYQVVLDALALTTCYPAFLITADVPVIYMHQFWATVTKHNASYRVKIDNKRFSVNVEVFRYILNICPKIPGQEFDAPLSEEETLSFIKELGQFGEIKFITDVSVDHLHQPWRAFTTIINKCLSGKELNLQSQRKLKRNLIQAMLDSDSSEETPSKKKPAKAKKDVPSTKKPTTKPKPTKKKAPVKADRGKVLNVLSKVALSEASQLKEATKRSKKDFYISHVSGSCDGTDFELGVPDEQQRKISGIDEGTGDSGEEEDDDEDESDNDCNDDDGDNDDNDDDNDDERTESDKDENHNLNQSNEEHEEEGEEYADERVHTPKNHELTDEEDNAKEENEEEKDDAEELYRDVNVNLRKEDVEITNANQGGADQHNVSQVSGFEQVEEDA
ncbi:hypothetical protein Tco_1150658 [Tanacetum coccineum]